VEAPKYDVFLSHRRGDKPAVEELARRLVRKGIEPWLDKWHLIPGTPWQEAIEKALSECTSVAVCIGPGGTGPWQDEEIRAAISQRVQDRGFRVIPVLLPGARREEIGPLPAFLAATTWVEFRDTLDDEEALHRLVSGILGNTPGHGSEGIVQGATPYRGLQYFDVNDSLFFVGRRTLTEELLDKLRSGDRFLAVLGASGSGKSSLVRAGLLASLKQGRIAGSDTWPQAILKPGDRPLERLVDALVKAMPLADDPIELIGKLGEDPRRLYYAGHQALRDTPADRRLVLFVDQFEEVFTGRDEAQSKALVGNLLHASMVEDGRILVLLTLRTDFFGHCSPDLSAALKNHHVLVGPMIEEELRSAIEHPAALVGCELEPGLTDLLLQETEGQSGSLPLLQHALLEIWNRRQGRRLTVEAYREIGGVRGALERHAEEVYGSFNDAEKEICRRVFLRLVQLGDGTVATRRRLALNELRRDQDDAVVRSLTDARLLTTDGGQNATVELAHEALITGWKRFQEWLGKNREAIRLRLGLEQASKDWATSSRDDSYLYQGTRLAQIEEWIEVESSELSEIEREFLAISKKVLLVNSKREERNARRFKVLSFGLAIFLLISMLITAFAMHQVRVSNKQRRLSLAAALAGRVKSVAQTNPQLALLLSIKAMQWAESAGEPRLPVAEESLRWALRNNGGRPLPGGKVSGVAISSDRRWLLGLDKRRHLLIWDLAKLKSVRPFWDMGRLDTPSINNPLFSPQSDQVIVTGLDAVTLLNVDISRRIVLSRLRFQGERRSLDLDPFSANGEWLVTYKAKGVVLRNRSSSFRRAALIEISADPAAHSFSHDSRWLAVADAVGGVTVWSLKDRAPKQVQSIDLGTPVQSLFFDPKYQAVVLLTGKDGFGYRYWPIGGSLGDRYPLKDCNMVFLMAQHVDGYPWFFCNAKIWKITGPDRVETIEIGHRVSPVAFTPKRDGLIVCAHQGGCYLNKLGPRGGSRFLVGQTLFGRKFVAFSPDGDWLVIHSGSEAPRVKSLSNDYGDSEPREYVKEGSLVLAVFSNERILAISRNSIELRGLGGKILSSMPYDHRSMYGFPAASDPNWVGTIFEDKIRLWKISNDKIVGSHVLDAHSSYNLAIDPSGKWLAAVSHSGRVYVWSLPKLDSAPRIFDYDSSINGGVTSSSFSSDGSFLAIGHENRSILELRIDKRMINKSNVYVRGDNDEPLDALTFSPNGRWLVFGGRGDKLVGWERSGREIKLENHGGALDFLAFSPDGNWLASSDYTGKVQLWKFEDGVGRTPILLKGDGLERDGYIISQLVFTSDSKALLALGSGRVVLRWDLDRKRLLDMACQAIGRNLDEQEWESYIEFEPYRERNPCSDVHD
jgi:WD40 repeat protein